MRGGVTHAFNDMRLEELPEPKSEPGWAVLRTKVVQPSVTEVQLFYGEYSKSYDKVKKKLAILPTRRSTGLSIQRRSGFPSLDKPKESLSIRR